MPEPEYDVPDLLRQMATQLEAERATFRELLEAAEQVNEFVGGGAYHEMTMFKRLRAAIAAARGDE